MIALTTTQVRLFASAKSWIEGEAVRQLHATARFASVRRAAGFPDLHPGNPQRDSTPEKYRFPFLSRAGCSSPVDRLM